MKQFSFLSALTIASIASACIILGVSLYGYTRIFFNHNDMWFFIIMDIKNNGLAMSFLSGQDVMLLASIQLSCLLILTLVETKNRGELFGWILIMGGGFSNLIERVIFNEVTDYIYIGFFGFKQFPIFNVADLLIFIGAIFIFYGMCGVKKTIHNISENN